MKQEQSKSSAIKPAAAKAAVRPIPKRQNEFAQLWQDVLRPWTWPLLTVALFVWAVFRQGAETPFDTALFAALSAGLLCLAILDNENRKALSRLVGWRWPALGLVAVWAVMALQFLPIPFLSGGSWIWAKANMVTIDPDLTVRAMVGLGSAVAFFILGAIFGADRNRRELVLALLALGLIPIFFQALDTYITKVSLFEYRAQRVGPRMEGTFLNANTFAILMTMIFAGGLGVFLSETRHFKGRERAWVQLAAIIVSVGAAICVYFSMSRAAWFLAFGIVFALALLLRPSLRLQTTVFGTLVFLTMLIVWNSAEQLGLPIRPLNFQDGIDGRLADWRPGLDLTLQRPWLGWGAGTFARVMEPVREAPIAASSLIVITPQNSLLLVSSETGLVGLIAWGFLAVGIVKFAVNGLRIRSASVPIATALILASIATFLQSLFDFPMSIPVVSALWAFLMGYAGGLGSKSRRRRAARSNAGSAATL